MTKLIAFKAKCSDGKNYVGFAPEEIIDDVLNNYRDVCNPPEIISRDVDIVEVSSPKDKLKSRKESNDEDILAIEVK